MDVLIQPVRYFVVLHDDRLVDRGYTVTYPLGEMDGQFDSGKINCLVMSKELSMRVGSDS